MHFLQNSQRERAKIKNLHSHICINVISSSGRFALPPLFGELEQRGVVVSDVLICSEIAEDDPGRSNIVQMFEYGLRCSHMVQDGSKWPEMVPYGPRCLASNILIT